MRKANLAAASAIVLLATACAVSGVEDRELPPPIVLLLSGPDGPRGSGVVIRDDRVLSADHVENVTHAGTFEVTERLPHPELDLMLLHVPGVRGTVRFGEMPGIYDPVTCYGFHRGMVLMRTDGYQSDKAGWMSAEVIGGCSGGACVNGQGELIGIIIQVGFAETRMGDFAAVPHIAGYTPLTDSVRSWIHDQITP